ncbi:hypothetical protein K1719_039431 [Acacia pycnantha]|nr:hypothetical protein K1719_039431 [Acacia pycnantha]
MASTTVTTREPTAMAQDIPLFGFQKNLRKAEEVAEEIVREGFEATDKGLETAERGLVTAKRGIEAVMKGIEAAEREISDTLNFGGLTHAGVVAGAEFLVFWWLKVHNNKKELKKNLL